MELIFISISGFILAHCLREGTVGSRSKDALWSTSLLGLIWKSPTSALSGGMGSGRFDTGSGAPWQRFSLKERLEVMHSPPNALRTRGDLYPSEGATEVDFESSCSFSHGGSRYGAGYQTNEFSGGNRISVAEVGESGTLAYSKHHVNWDDVDRRSETWNH
jgi:hypothetical protein